MSARKPLDAEMVRILTAAAEGRLYVSASGRWKIMGDKLPARRARELLMWRGYLAYSWRVQRGDAALTESGARALAEAAA
jgi:hypothetical protein